MDIDTWGVLNQALKQRRRFDPAERNDLKELSYFIKYNRWKNGCPFYIEWPHRDVVSMCQSKYTQYMLDKLTK